MVSLGRRAQAGARVGGEEKTRGLRPAFRNFDECFGGLGSGRRAIRRSQFSVAGAGSAAGSGATGAASSGSPRRSVERSAATRPASPIVLACRLERAFHHRALHALALQRDVELLDRFSILVRDTCTSASRCALRSESAVIFSSTRVSAVSRVFSVFVNMLLRLDSAARARLPGA